MGVEREGEDCIFGKNFFAHNFRLEEKVAKSQLGMYVRSMEWPVF